MDTTDEIRAAAVRLKTHVIDQSMIYEGMRDDVRAVIAPHLPPERPKDSDQCTPKNAVAAGMVEYATNEHGPVYKSPKGLVRFWPKSTPNVWVTIEGECQRTNGVGTVGDLRTLCRLLNDPLPGEGE